MAKPEAKLTFEQVLERLGQIVHSLEEGQTGLEESLASYEEGVGLLKQCHSLLESAEKKIRLLSGLDAEGRPVVEPFDATASLDREQASKAVEEEGEATRRGRRRRAAVEAKDDTDDTKEGSDGVRGLF